MYTNHKLQNTLLLHRNEFSTNCTPSFHSLHYFQQEITSYKFLAKIETHSSIGCHYKLTSHYFSFSHYQSAYPQCENSITSSASLHIHYVQAKGAQYMAIVHLLVNS